MKKQTTSFDATTKTIYGDLFKRWEFGLETEREIFSHSCNIDLVVTCKETEQNKLDNTLFAHFRGLNAIELKGFRELNYQRF